jgi:hypothetical protein
MHPEHGIHVQLRNDRVYTCNVLRACVLVVCQATQFAAVFSYPVCDAATKSSAGARMDQQQVT